MAVERHRRLRALFDEALLQDPSVRDAFLDRACAADPDLRPDVARLLAAHAGAASSFLERPPWLPPPPPSVDADFRGTARFRIRRQLGAGGMGVVYEVDDTARREVVALKTLRRATAADIYRLKREFRSLANVAHPNLVSLYDLFVEDDRCFFTMELVRGLNFIDYVRGAGDAGCSDERLRSAFRQLVDGVVGPASHGQAPPRHQAVERAGDARRTRRHPRLRSDHRAGAAQRLRRREHARRHACLHGARSRIGRGAVRGQPTGTPSASRCSRR